MIVNVHMKDGRTVFQFASRGDFRRIVGTQPCRDEDGWKQTAWARDSARDVEGEWRNVRLSFIAGGSVAFVIEAESEGLGVPAAETARERQAAWEARQVEEVAA